VRATIPFASLAVLAIGIAGHISRADAATAYLVELRGKCWLTVNGKSLPCIPKLLNTNYPNRRTGFYIVTEEGATYTWSGASGQKPDPDSQILWLDAFITTINGTTSNSKAEGSCTFKNPYRGQPSTLICAARYQGGEAQFRFEHDGSAPIESELPMPQ
jgi:hypothetical protein